MSLTMVIDASNLRQGGGISHLRNLLRSTDLESSPFGHCILYAVSATLAQVEDRPWLEKVAVDNIYRTPFHRAFWQFLKLPRLVREAEAAVLFSPGGIVPFGCPCPCVTMARNMLPFDAIERARYGSTGMRLKFIILRNIQRWSFGRASGLIYLTDHACRVIGSQLAHSAPHSIVIPHGIEERFRKKPRPQRSLEDCTETEPFRLLYVSILSPYKHQWNVAAAVERLRKEGLPIAIDFVGPWERRGYKKLKPYLDSNRGAMTYRDSVPYGEIAHLYHRSDAFVYASTCENLPNILLEAMAAGLPIACSGREPMPSILGKCGVYFDAENPVSIAAALKSLVTNESMRQAIATGAYKKSLELHWDRCAKETLEFIAQTVHSCGNRIDSRLGSQFCSRS